MGKIVDRATRVSLTIRTVLKVLSEDSSPANQAEQEELRRIEKHWYVMVFIILLYRYFYLLTYFSSRFNAINEVV